MELFALRGKDAAYLFRLAEKDEAETVYALYRSVIGRQYCTWDEEYPGREEIENDMGAENLFILERERGIIGAVSIAPENELDGYDCWSRKEKAGEFARVVISTEYQGRGIAKVLVRNVLKEMKRRGLEAVHISVAEVNIPARRVYDGLGFHTVGREEMWGGLYYLCERELPISDIQEE